MYLFLDTETTGLAPDSRIVSICWSIFANPEQHVATRYHIICPDGFTIPPDATAIHGISTAMARKKGITLAGVLAQLRGDISDHGPALYIGHNVSYDRPIVLNEYARLRAVENFSPLPTFCTMKSTTHICCLPRYRGGYKWPTLDELYRHLFGRFHAYAHDAENDVRACVECFFELHRRGLIPGLRPAPGAHRTTQLPGKPSALRSRQQKHPGQRMRQ
jgi:DNA polymerase III subunit epsilon